MMTMDSPECRKNIYRVLINYHREIYSILIEIVGKNLSRLQDFKIIIYLEKRENLFLI